MGICYNRYMNTTPMVTGFGTKNASGNEKLMSKRPDGPDVFATYRPVGATCTDCPLLAGGCYAKTGNVAIHALESGRRTFDPFAWATALPEGALVRWNVTGDIWGEDGAEYRDAIKRAHEARPDLKGWLYTHAWRRPEIQAWAKSLPSGVRCIASADSDADAVRAFDAGFRTVAIVHEADGSGHWTRETADAVRDELSWIADSFSTKVVPCPAQRSDLSVGCADCTACMRDGLVPFASHGMGKKKAIKMLKVYREGV